MTEQPTSTVSSTGSAPGKGDTARNPLEPMATIVTAICGLVAVFLVLKAYAALALGGAFGWGDGSVCVTDPYAHGSGNSLSHTLFAPSPGVDVSYVPQYCDNSPDGGRRLLSTLTELPSSVLYIGALFLLCQLIRAALKDGPYTVRTAGRLRVLGWALAAGSIVCHVAESTANSALLSSLKSVDHRPLLYDVANGMPYLAILTGIGLLTLARIMRIGATMREDLEGVV